MQLWKYLFVAEPYRKWEEESDTQETGVYAVLWVWATEQVFRVHAGLGHLEKNQWLWNKKLQVWWKQVFFLWCQELGKRLKSGVKFYSIFPFFFFFSLFFCFCFLFFFWLLFFFFVSLSKFLRTCSICVYCVTSRTAVLISQKPCFPKSKIHLSVEEDTEKLLYMVNQDVCLVTVLSFFVCSLSWNFDFFFFFFFVRKHCKVSKLWNTSEQDFFAQVERTIRLTQRIFVEKKTGKGMAWHVLFASQCQWCTQPSEIASPPTVGPLH